MKKIILASSSPRRKKILEDIGIKFEIIKSNYEEKLDNDLFSTEKIEMLAFNKAIDVLKKVDSSDNIILSADTVVVLDEKILGKPIDKDDAILTLKKLSGKRHSVVTSSCAIFISENRKKIITTTSYVTFKKLSDEIIEKYVNEFTPLDKAGSYGIQELPEDFIQSVEGSIENIIGLCPNAVIELLK